MRNLKGAQTQFLIIFILISFPLWGKNVSYNTSKEINDFVGYYFVPNGDDLLPYSNFKMTGIKVLVTPEKIKVSYNLPVELTGIKNSFTLEGKLPSSNRKSFFELIGQNSQARCLIQAKDNYLCLVKFKKFKVNKNKLNEAIVSQYSDQNLDKRKLVSQNFWADPIGLLNIRKL